MNELTLRPIGELRCGDDGFYIEVLPEYRPALIGLDGFSHIQILWHFSAAQGCALTETKPYKNGPEKIGTFATRSPNRPNPIALTTAYVTYIDGENGIVGLAYADAFDGSPVFDIKPYTPSLDRAESPSVPEWCAHWPASCEESADFDWENEFNF